MSHAAVALLALSVACISPRASVPLAQPTKAAAGPPGPVAPPPPFEVSTLGRDGKMDAEPWTDTNEAREPHEDNGPVVYAQRRTTLRADELEAGWLEPGARVGVVAVSHDHVLVALFPWGAHAFGYAHAWVDRRDVGPMPPRDAPPFGQPSGVVKRIAHGQDVTLADGTRLASTFCGDVEVVSEGRGKPTRIVQREDGVAIEGILAVRATWAPGGCGGRVLARDERDGGMRIYYNSRWHPYVDTTPPPELVDVGPFEAPTFAQLVAKRATVYWLVNEDNRPAECDALRLAPDRHSATDGEITSKRHLPDGMVGVTTFGLGYSSDKDTRVMLTGPSTQWFTADGKPEEGVGMGCGAEYKVVASDKHGLVMDSNVPGLGELRMYDPRDTERWYLDRASCEADASSMNRKVAVAFAPHVGC